jgi:indole-3-glycerol phosphate synthase
LTRISPVSNIPLLRKDFIRHEIQIYEAIIAGADAILLIVAALDDETLGRLYREARDFQLDVLVEVHDMPEMERALELGADLIGINNRNLKTFKTDLATTEQLADEVGDDVILVSESGIKTTADCLRVLEAGANAILVGETLMKSNNPAETMQQWLDIRI